MIFRQSQSSFYIGPRYVSNVRWSIFLTEPAARITKICWKIRIVCSWKWNQPRVYTFGQRNSYVQEFFFQLIREFLKDSVRNLYYIFSDFHWNFSKILSGTLQVFFQKYSGDPFRNFTRFLQEFYKKFPKIPQRLLQDSFKYYPRMCHKGILQIFLQEFPRDLSMNSSETPQEITLGIPSANNSSNVLKISQVTKRWNQHKFLQKFSRDLSSKNLQKFLKESKNP